MDDLFDRLRVLSDRVLLLHGKHNQKLHGNRRKMGVFDPNNPPVSDNPITALKVDGKIMFDTTAKTHAQAAENLKVNLDKITAGGFIADGKYVVNSADAVRLGRVARARKRREEKRKARFERITGRKSNAT
jgi:hypothetical protein